MKLKIVSTKVKDGKVEYLLSLQCNLSKAMARDSILEGIKVVFGYDEDELVNGSPDLMHSYARKVYSRLRSEMGVSTPEIARELNKAPASVRNFLRDKGTKVQEYCEAVLNG